MTLKLIKGHFNKYYALRTAKVRSATLASEQHLFCLQDDIMVSTVHIT